MATKTIMETGCHAASYAVRDARVDVVPGYPITPQTSVMEFITDLIEAGEMDARFIPVEGEHSVMAATVAASSAGARVFTATASQGLLYMHEVLHMAAGCRLPIVMANVNRGVMAPWTLWADHNDSLAQNNTGWLQYYCASVQEIYNTILQAYRVAEQVNIPVMVNFDGFALSHCMMPLTMLDAETVDAFLPPHDPQWKLHPNCPSSMSNVTEAKEYSEYRAMLAHDTLASLEVMKKAAAEYRDVTGMWDGDSVECYRMEDAEVVAFAMGSMASELRLSIDALREQGIKAGLLRLRVYRPFPADDILAAIPEGALVVALDKNRNFGHSGGVLAAELRGVLYGVRNDVAVRNTVVGIGGVDTNFNDMAEIIRLEYTLEKEGE